MMEHLVSVSRWELQVTLFLASDIARNLAIILRLSIMVVGGISAGEVIAILKEKANKNTPAL